VIRQPKKKSIFKSWITWVIIGALSMAVGLFAFIAINRLSFYVINGISMAPELNHGEAVVMRQQSPILKNYIVFFNKPTNWDYMEEYGDNVILSKRAAAVPGDWLEFDGEVFTVNGEPIFNVVETDYECAAGEYPFSHGLQINEVWVTGDNYNHSLDSRRIFCDGNTEESFVQARDVMNYGEIVFSW